MSSRNDTESVESMRQRLERLETAVDVTGLGLWEWDLRSGELRWNQRNRDLFGVTHQDSLTIEDYTALVHPDDREVVAAAYREASERPDGGDFSMEYRTLLEPDGKVRWLVSRGRVIKDGERVVLAAGSNIDITDRKAAEQRRSLVLRELAHRAKNGILVMMAIVSQTARSAASVADFEALLTSRLKSMADSQDLVTETAGRSLPMADLLGRALMPFDRARFDVDPGLSQINIPTEMVVAMALLLHELSTNAVKYGALSASTGRVRLSLTEATEGKAVLAWAEAGGPPVAPVTRKGFGSRLLDISLRNNGGHVEGVFAPDGFRATIHFPTVGL